MTGLAGSTKISEITPVLEGLLIYVDSLGILGFKSCALKLERWKTLRENMKILKTYLGAITIAVTALIGISANAQLATVNLGGHPVSSAGSNSCSGTYVGWAKMTNAPATSIWITPPVGSTSVALTNTTPGNLGGALNVQVLGSTSFSCGANGSVVINTTNKIQIIQYQHSGTVNPNTVFWTQATYY
ncbi:MAG: hypothetical protein JF609_06065 [Verrucomicrobia bacterium]|nr:hypothetical protein [Verrucomicrobiota bacterium]